MHTARAQSAVAWPDLAASAVWWAYDRAPEGLDAMFHVGRRYLAPLLQPRMPVRRLGLATDVEGGLLTAFGQSMTLDHVVHRTPPDHGMVRRAAVGLARRHDRAPAKRRPHG